MSDLKVCRICLNIDVKMYEWEKHQLKDYYEQIMSTKLKKNDTLPRFFCYECAALLHKFYKFKNKCENGLNELKRLLGSGGVTLQKVAKIDRATQNLDTTIGVTMITTRVKTYFERHRRILKRKSRENPSITSISLEMVNIPDDDQAESIKNDDDHNEINEQSDIVTCEQESADKMDFLIDDDDKAENITEECTASDNNIEVNATDIQYEEVIKEIKLPKLYKKSKSKKKRKKIELKAIERKKRELNEKNWQRFYLTEEDAVNEFQSRAQDPKYISAVYKCTFCLKGFSKEDMMKRHNKLRHSESNGSIECRFCRIRFKWKSLLRRHIREHYNKYKCLRCDLIFSRETSAQHHDQFHNGVTRTCEYCNETFKHLSTYYTHLRKHRSKHLCALCGESFVSEFGLYMHRRVKHVMDAERQEDDSIEETTYCERCDIKFESRRAYEEHLIHSAMHSISGESPAPMNLKGGTVVRRAPRKQTPCTICNKNFSTLVAYMKHHQAEHPGQPAPAAARAPPSADPHQRHICEICGALLAPNSMYSHVNTHTREKQYTCATCGMQFNAKGTLQRHYLTHTGEKPVECSLCDKRFTQVASMKLHYRTIHLKQPYPKRNRKKKSEDSDETALIAEYYQNKEAADDLPLERWRTMRL
ncbi:zinc finger protein 808-like [Bombyx mandarina]|uniref:Zinc finger protein 808-like n=1 Tax=Bombyx mandarina TaxID=7092 RepID=A0A6J2JIR1_BOMMA|nr:zinc finger protein 808-like [Bombyx mandarina]